MADSIVIPARFRGPPQSGNGGYVAGVMAETLGSDGAVEVTLRAPIPLDTPMHTCRDDDGRVRLMLGDTLIAEAIACELALEVPEPPPIGAVRNARADSPSFYRNANPLIVGGTGFHPVCVCCGADVAEQEGLHVYAAPVPGFDGVAAAWRPHPAFADADGHLPAVLIWTAMDCPGQFAYLVSGIRTGLLGRMTARILRPVAADAELLVTGWRIGIERRKHFAGTALFDSDGALCACAYQTWIGRMD
jgi:hypothetical protein